MAKAEHEGPSADGADTNKTNELRVTRHTAIGTLVKLAAEAMNADAQVYEMTLAVDTLPITHARRLKLVSSEPPLPGYPTGAPYDLFVDKSHVHVEDQIRLKTPHYSDVGMAFTVQDISVPQEK